jgi:hypothetical protein
MRSADALICHDPRLGLSQISWRTSVAHHATEDKIPRGFCVVSDSAWLVRWVNVIPRMGLRPCRGHVGRQLHLLEGAREKDLTHRHLADGLPVSPRFPRTEQDVPGH